MSKAFTKEPDGDQDEDEFDTPDDMPHEVKNYMTPAGHAALQEERRWLVHDERPKIVDIVSWAAGNGDRSENGDYIYNKKRLREIDRRLRYLNKRLEKPEIVDPKLQQGIEQVFFGATVTYIKEDGTQLCVTLVGRDEADFSKGKIYWQSPVGKALLKSSAGDAVDVRTESGIETIEVLSIEYVL